MPTTFKKRRAPARRYKRRTTRKPKASKLSTITIKPSKNPIPDVVFVKLPYADNVTYTTTISPSAWQWRNSVFDPDYTGTGHQPFGRDQWSLWYKKYIVYGIKYHVTIINESNVDALFSISGKNHTGASSVMTLAREKPYSKTGIIPYGGSGNYATRKGYMDCARVRGISKHQLTNEKAFWTDKGSSPTADQSAYLTVESQAADALTSCKVRIIVLLTYYVKWFDRETIVSS